MLTLFTTPVIYIYFDRWAGDLRDWRSGRRASTAVP
jgi:hypothetical protein